MREIKSEIPSSSSRVLSVLGQYRQYVTEAISTVVSMTNFSDSKHTSQPLYQTISFAINSGIRSISILAGVQTMLFELGISDLRIVLPLSVIPTIYLFFQIHSQIQIQTQSQILTETIDHIELQNIELLWLDQVNSFFNQFQNNDLRVELDPFNSFFAEQKSSSSVFVLNSENDQLYHALGFDSSKIPEEIKCPLTDQIFTTPVTPKDSKVEAIELSALQYWFEQKQKANPYQQPTHPISRHILDMKHLVIDEKLAKKAKNFVEKKVARIGNLLIYSSRLYSQFEREQCIGLLANYAFLVLDLIPPKSFQNLVIGLSLFDMMISHLPAPKKQIVKALTMYAHCANFFTESQRIAVRKSKPQNLLAITHQPAL